MATERTRTPRRTSHADEPAAAPDGQVIPASGPQFGEPTPTPDPAKFSVKHGSDQAAYTILDREQRTLRPRPFPVVEGIDEPVVQLAEAFGDQGSSIVAQIKAAGQIVFHSVGDTGSTRGPESQSQVADKMTADYSDTHPEQVPSFFYHLGDVVYSFGETQY